MDGVPQQCLRLQAVGDHVPLPGLAEVEDLSAVRLGHLGYKLHHGLGPALVHENTLIVRLLLGAKVVRADGDLRRGPLAGVRDDFLVGVVRAVDVEDHEVGVERIQVVLSAANQPLRAKAGDGEICELEVGVRKARPHVALELVPPLLGGDRLPVDENPHAVPMFRRAGGEERHGALDPVAVLGCVLLRLRQRILARCFLGQGSRHGEEEQREYRDGCRRCDLHECIS